LVKKDPELGLLVGTGELAANISAFEWRKTPLGPMALWPTSIKTTVGLILRSPVPIVTLWGEQGTMIYNDAYAVFAGGRHPQLLGSAVREGWPEVADFNDNVMKVGLAGGTLSYQDQELTLFRTGAPEQVWMNLDYSPVIGESGTPIGVIAIVVETTQAVRASRQLRQNETRLRFLDAVSKETAKSTDADTILAVTTRMVGEHLGVTSCAYADMDLDQDGFTIRGDWAAPGAMHIIGHYRLADFGKLAVRNLGSGKPLVINDNLRELDPEEAATFQNIGIGATICMPLVKEGRLTALMAIHHKGPHVWSENELALITEVTERSWAHIERVRSEAEVRRSEQRFREELERRVAERTAALQQSEKNLRTVFETSYMIQGLLTPLGKIIYVNATSLASISSRLEDVVGKNFWETPWFAGTPGVPEKVRDGIVRVAAGESIHTAMQLNMPTGQRIYEFSMRPALDETGRVIALVSEAVETTERVRAEQALRQAQKIEAIGNLTGGIAHDFNNLLMAVLGSLELLRRRLPDDPGLLRLVDIAAEGARRGRSLTERMLAFARRQDLKPERVDVEKLVAGMTELMERTLGPTITLDVRMPMQLPQVDVDPNQLESGLLNLAMNGRDAMYGEGPLTIIAQEIELEIERDGLLPGKYVCLSVSDAGEGMDEETMKRATEPFFTTKGVGKGTGLGLPMVQGLAQQSGGALLLKSAPGEGTTAEIWLPAQTRQDQGPASTSLGAEDTTVAPDRLRVLAVDDDALVLMSTTDMLEDLGHAVIAVESGNHALTELETATFDLIITDHAMPGMTGSQLADQVRARYPALNIILASGYAELSPDALGDVQRLSKPFSQADLANAIRRACDRTRAWVKSD
jgi:signal transduction histidine kinase/ActR/RegA family two-component response regulator